MAILSAGQTAEAHAVASVPERYVVRLAQSVQRRRWTGAVWGLLALFAMGVVASSAQTPAPSEYQIKAAFLYNFAKFVEWPPQMFLSPNTAINLCILGEDPFGDDLEQTIQGKIIHGRAVVIRRFKGMQGLDVCHVLFVSSSEQKRLPQLLDSLKGRSVLTVGDIEGFAAAGGMINFTMQGNKVRFAINVDVTERAGLKLSSQLLKLATIIRNSDRH